MLSADCAAPKEVFAWGIKGQDACPAGYEEITDDATCQRGASQLCTGDKCKFFPMSTSGSHGAIQTGTAAKICNWCTGCDDGKPVFVDRGHGSIAYWLCKKTEVFAWGTKGQDACPAGYQEITDDATCQRGASQLCTGDKCKFFPMSESGSHGAIQTGTAAK